jgi:hypothetical protein
VLEHDIATRFRSSARGTAQPFLLIRNRVSVVRKSLDLSRSLDERWWVPIDEAGVPRWDSAEAVDELPELVNRPPDGMRFPRAAPGKLAREVGRAERDFVVWRARRPVGVLANLELEVTAEAGEDREAFIERCLEIADRADDTAQERVRTRFDKKMRTLENRVARERDELERDRQQLAARKAEEKLGVVEGLFSVLLGSGSLRSASRSAASKIRSAASKRRMRQTAEGSVTESLHEIDRLNDDLEDLAEELQDEIDRIAEASVRAAEKVEIVDVRPIQRDVEVRDVWLVWG